MQEARMLGNYIENLAEEKGISTSTLSQLLGCSELQVARLFKGLSFASFSQISKLAEFLGTTVESLLSGDIDKYNRTVVHCMNDFQNNNNREKILDLIEGYVDIVDAVSATKN